MLVPAGRRSQCVWAGFTDVGVGALGRELEDTEEDEGLACIAQEFA